MSAATSHDFSLNQVVEGILHVHGQVSFLQIGSSDGLGIELLREYILNSKLTGLLVEPTPERFARRYAIYRHSALIGVREYVPGTTESGSDLWAFCETALASRKQDQIDLLSVGAGSLDHDVLKAFDFQRYRPHIVQYERLNQSPEQHQVIEAKLRSLGYVLRSNPYYTMAVRGVMVLGLREEAAPLAAIARQLWAEGRRQQAYTIFRQAFRMDPGDVALTMDTAKAAADLGEVGEALRLAAYARTIAPGDSVNEEVLEIARIGGEAFNIALDAGDHDRAEPIIDNLAVLFQAKCEGMALALAREMKKTEKAGAYATRMLERDPDIWSAHAALVDIARERGDIPALLYHQVMTTLLRERSENGDRFSFGVEAYYVISDILRHPDYPEMLKYVDVLRDAVVKLPQKHTDRKLYLKDQFFRMALESMDVSILETPLSDEPLPPRPLVYADHAGVELEIGEWKKQLLAHKPEVNFLAAADEGYLRRYGRIYLKSILNRCDVSCTVTICMTGKPENLKDVVQAIGIDDPRLFYVAEEFDPSYNVSFYSPLVETRTCANAYYQSVRFLVLDQLMNLLQVPFIITDIDLVLLGSVEGVLRRHDDKDIVLNRNEAELSYGSYYTANLILIRPGETARQFTKLQRRFLETALERDEIEHFIDQSGLSLASYYCQRNGLNRFGYFYKIEINNVMLNRAAIDDEIVSFAKSFVFFAYYGSQGDSALKLMEAVS